MKIKKADFKTGKKLKIEMSRYPDYGRIYE